MIITPAPCIPPPRDIVTPSFVLLWNPYCNILLFYAKGYNKRFTSMDSPHGVTVKNQREHAQRAPLGSKYVLTGWSILRPQRRTVAE